MSATPCARCDGCGEIANDEDGTPWNAWEALPEQSKVAIRLGLVKPLPCPVCHGGGYADPESVDEQPVAEGIEAALAHISRLLNASYGDHIDTETVLWRRVTKVSEEAGEVQKALRGLVGENPRKGRENGVDKVIEELLDCAGAALGAVYHLTNRDTLPMLRDRVQFADKRLTAAIES